MTEQEKYCARFGTIAVENGFLNIDRLQMALSEQIEDNLAARPHRVIGAICFEHGWMSPVQIEIVLNIMFNRQWTELETETV